MLYLLSLIVGVLLGLIISTVISRKYLFQISNSTSMLANLLQSLSLAVALAAVVVSVNVASDQASQSKKQYTRDRIDDMLNEEVKSSVKNLMEAATYSLTYMTMEQTIQKIKPENRPVPGQTKHKVSDGKVLNDAEYEKYIAIKANNAVDHISSVWSYLLNIRSCVASGLCDKEVAYSAACSAIDTVKFFQKQLEDKGSLLVIVDRNNGQSSFDGSVYMKMNVDLGLENIKFPCDRNFDTINGVYRY